MTDDAKVTTFQFAAFGYVAIGYVLGAVAGVITFIGAYIYCIATYGFLFGLGLGWLPSGILAAIIGWAVVFLWGPAIVIFLLAALALLAMVVSAKLAYGVIFGTVVGWLIWRVAPKSLFGRG
jgi:hypothetical protein